MLVNPETYVDCEKYYAKTYVKFKEGGESIFFIKNVDKRYIYAQALDQEDVLIDHQQGYTIDYVIPKKTVFQHGEHAVILSRIPARMWKKGMNKLNTEFKILGATGWVSYPFDINIINGFINKPSYYVVEDAINEFNKSDHLQSAAITPRISIGRSGLVFVDTVNVGRWLDETKTISVKKLFAPEIKPLFSPFSIKSI